MSNLTITNDISFCSQNSGGILIQYGNIIIIDGLTVVDYYQEFNYGAFAIYYISNYIVMNNIHLNRINA